jgi:hypothetical protein
VRTAVAWIADEQPPKPGLRACVVTVEQFDSGEPDRRPSVQSFCSKRRFKELARTNRVFGVEENRSPLDHNVDRVPVKPRGIVQYAKRARVVEPRARGASKAEHGLDAVGGLN